MLGLGTASERKRLFAAILIAALLLLPLPDLAELATRATVRESVETRAPYAAAVTEAERCSVPVGSEVLMIAQDTAGYEWQTMRYCLQPNYRLPKTVWSFRCPGDTNNIWTTYLSAEELTAYCRENYDYVLLFLLDDYFLEHYAACFAEGTALREGAWYRVDPTSGLLTEAAN